MSNLARLDDTSVLDKIADDISKIISEESGNILGVKQRPMVLSKIKRRILDLKKTPEQYYEYIQTHLHEEKKQLLTLITVHHSFFFREFIHFEYLQNNLAAIVETVKARGDTKIKIYTAACSRGQESYSLALFLHYHLKPYPNMSYEIFGTDIDPKSVETAKNAVYPYDDVKSIPNLYLNGNWQRGTGDIAQYAKVKPHIHKNCQFETGNLLTCESSMRGKKFDIIFCRNVFIYFTDDIIRNVCSSFKKHLFEEGFLVTGLSESLKQMTDLGIQALGPSVYSFGEKIAAVNKGLATTEPPSLGSVTTDGPTKYVPPAVQSPALGKIPKPIRMLVVDDSASIVKLLSRIFSSDPDFELVGTAMNGLEAEEFLKHQSVDAMTLDIHMPEMNGVEYLRRNHTASHPKVVVVTSASREDTKYAQKTIRYGASDLVEKPALNNLTDRAEEIKMKIKMSFLNDQNLSTNNFDKLIERNFEIKNLNQKSRIIFANFSDRKRLVNFFKDIKGDAQPTTFIVIEGNANYLDLISTEFENENLENFTVLEEGQTVGSGNQIYLIDYATQMVQVASYCQAKRTSVCVFGQGSDKVKTTILEMNNIQLLLEDVAGLNQELREVASDIFPWTSFSHLSTEFLARDQ